MSTGRTRLRARVPRTLLAAAALLAATSRAGAQEVLLTTEQAAKEIFPEAARTAAERHALTAAVKRGLEAKLGRHIEEDEVDVLKVYDASGVLRGYAVVTEEIGKYRPIT